MTNIFKLPNGGAFYLNEELTKVCGVITKAKEDYKLACKGATLYADAQWKLLPFYKRFLYKWDGLMSLSPPAVYWAWYGEKKLVELDEYKGSGIIRSIAVPYFPNLTIAANQILVLGRSGKNCYLNPKQIEVVLLCNKFIEGRKD